MAFDIDAELAALARQRAVANASLFDFTTERVLLAAVLADDAIEDRPPWLPHRVPVFEFTTVNGRVVDVGITAELEVDDFGDYRHKVAFSALRNLTARTGTAPDLLELSDQIDRHMATRDVGRYEHPLDLVWLFDLVTTQMRVSVSWITAALCRLRGLANHRRMA